MKNKKGMLLVSETLKIVIGVICVSLLVFLLVSLYLNSSSEKSKKEAKILLGDISEAYASFDLNTTKKIFSNISPAGWKIFIFTDEELKPNSCSGLDCICICDDVLLEVGKNQLSKCDKKGVCEIFQPLVEVPDIEIDKTGATSIMVYKQQEWYGVIKYEFG